MTIQFPGSSSPALLATEHAFESWDGTRLFYRAWMPAGKPRRAVILFHRGHEHSARWSEVVDKLDLPDCAFFAWDARGHGRSPGERGDAPGFDSLVKDADGFARHVSTVHGIDMADMAVIANSVGSVIAASWVHDYAPPIRALVLASPALRVRLYVPFAVPGLRLLQKLGGNRFISSYVKGRLLTHDVEKQIAYDMDPLITPRISVRVLLGLHDAATRLLADGGAITTPVLMLTAGDDFVVDQGAQHRFFDGLGSRLKQREAYAGFHHDIFNERDNALPIGRARAFLMDVFDNPPRGEDLRRADMQGPAREDYDRLRLPLPRYSLKGMGYGAMGWLMRRLGRLSRGIALGWDAGFDSGAMLDYVYRNRAQGKTWLGRLIDRFYLDSPGWKGIRQRKLHLEARISQTIDRVVKEAGEARIVDLATGHGRYVLDALNDRRDQPVTALLRDFDPANVAAGRALAAEMGLSNVTFEQGDAFDRAAVKTLPNRPNIAIVSGLYELFPENGPVRNSLAGLTDAVRPGGYLIYTNQPWHPQVEFIARVLVSHRDFKPWVMRLRSQREMDQLVEEAGFEKIAQDMDAAGIFTVSVARRV